MSPRPDLLRRRSAEIFVPRSSGLYTNGHGPERVIGLLWRDPRPILRRDEHLYAHGSRMDQLHTQAQDSYTTAAARAGNASD